MATAQTNAPTPDQAIEETQETRRLETIRLAQACRLRYEDVIRDFNTTDEQLKKKTLIRAIIDQGDVLYHWKQQYELLPRDALFRKGNFAPHLRLEDDERRRHFAETVQKTNVSIQKFSVSTLRKIKKDLSSISKILRGRTQMKYEKKSYGIAMSELKSYVSSLTSHNGFLVMYTKVISDEMSFKEGVSPSQAAEKRTTDIKDVTIKTLAQKCHGDYMKVSREFKLILDYIFEAWTASRDNAKSVEENAGTKDDPRGDTMEEYMEKNVSHRSVLHQCRSFNAWANRNGVYEQGDSSLDHRLQKLVSKLDDPLKHQHTDPHIDEQIKQQLRMIEKTLWEMSGTLTGKRKSDKDTLALLLESGADSDDTISESTDSDDTDSESPDSDDTESSDTDDSNDADSDGADSDGADSDGAGCEDTDSSDMDSDDTDSDGADVDDADPYHTITELIPELQRLVGNLADYNKILDRLSQPFTETGPAEGGVCTDVERDDYETPDKMLDTWARGRSGEGDTTKAFRAS